MTGGRFTYSVEHSVGTIKNQEKSEEQTKREEIIDKDLAALSLTVGYKAVIGAPLTASQSLTTLEVWKAQDYRAYTNMDPTDDTYNKSTSYEPKLRHTYLKEELDDNDGAGYLNYQPLVLLFFVLVRYLCFN
uniref:Uncharacterized protein n=1 Tax=Ditylenchus dipsaci TaxID=166011 RepID=A0A915EQG8_9BILA